MTANRSISAVSKKLGWFSRLQSRSSSLRSCPHCRTFTRSGPPLRAAAKQTSGNSRSSSTGTAPVDAPIVLYRGGAPFRPWLYIFSGTVFVGAGLTLAPLIYDNMSYPNFGWKGWKREENGRIVAPELLPPGGRAAIAAFSILLGCGSAFFFFVVPMR